MKRLNMILLAVMVIFALALGACGDDDDDNDVSPDDDDDTSGDDDDTSDDDDTTGDDDDTTGDDDDTTGDDDDTTGDDDDTTGDDDDTTGDDDDTTGDDDDDDDDDNDDEAITDDFESYTVGSAPGGDWVVEVSDGASVTVIALTKDGSGKAIELNDPSEAATGGMGLDLSAATFIDSVFTLAWDWLWVDGDGQSIQMLGSGYNQFAVDFYVDHIEALEFNGWTTCATGTNTDQWYSFEVEVDPVNETFTVFIDGVESSCSDLGFYYAGYGFGLDAFQTRMYSDVNGGSTYLDNLVISAK